MARELVSVVFDRRKVLKKVKKAQVEILINFGKNIRKYIIYTTCTESQWKRIQNSKELQLEKQRYQLIAQAMITLNEEISIENLNKHLGLKGKVKSKKDEAESTDISEESSNPLPADRETNNVPTRKEESPKEMKVVKESKKEKPVKTTKEKPSKNLLPEDFTTKTTYYRTAAANKHPFIAYFYDSVNKANYKKGTYYRMMVCLDTLIAFGKLNDFEDLTPQNIREYHDFLNNGERAMVTVRNYHKSIRHVIKKAVMEDFIEKDPYNKVELPKAKCKTRKPLNEEELLKIISHNFEGATDQVRDLFIFSAYTGLAFSDVMLFKYSTMTETYKDQVYIDGKRLKTGTEFYTPILPHAMDILKKYDYTLPHFTNEYTNRVLKDIKKACDLKKPLTFHIARHSFATLCLSHDVPISEVAKMLGHKDIRTTQIYAKVLTETIARHTTSLIGKLQ